MPRLLELIDWFAALLCDPNCPHHRITNTIPRGHAMAANWADDKPGETKKNAEARAHETIRKAADDDNPTAKRMARNLDRDNAKAERAANRQARRQGKGQRQRD